MPGGKACGLQTFLLPCLFVRFLCEQDRFYSQNPQGSKESGDQLTDYLRQTLFDIKEYQLHTSTRNLLKILAEGTSP